jgi:hypothetical protein
MRGSIISRGKFRGQLMRDPVSGAGVSQAPAAMRPDRNHQGFARA